MEPRVDPALGLDRELAFRRGSVRAYLRYERLQGGLPQPGLYLLFPVVDR